MPKLTGRPKRRAVLVEEDDIDTIESELTPGEIEDIEKQKATDEWLGEFQGRFTDQPVKVLVEKFENGEWSICRKYPLASFDHEAIRDEFGGGRYRATLFDPGGHYIKGGRNSFTFANPLGKKPEEKPANPFENPVVSMMLESMKSNNQMLLGITQSMIQSNSGKATGLGEMIEAMKGMQTLAPKAEKPLDNFKETLGLMKLVKEVTGEGEGDSKGGLLSEIKEFLEVWPMIKDQIPTLKGGTPQTPPVAVSVPSVPPSTTTVTGGNPPMDPVTQKIIVLIPKLVSAAKVNAPINEWSEFLLDALEDQIMPVLYPQMKAQYGALIENEDDVYDILIKYAKNPTEREKIYTAVAPLAPYKTWCDQVIEQAVRTLTQEENGATVMDAVGTPVNGAAEKD